MNICNYLVILAAFVALGQCWFWDKPSPRTTTVSVYVTQTTHVTDIINQQASTSLVITKTEHTTSTVMVPTVIHQTHTTSRFANKSEVFVSVDCDVTTVAMSY